MPDMSQTRGWRVFRFICAVLVCYWVLGGVYESVNFYAGFYGYSGPPPADTGFAPPAVLLAGLLWEAVPGLLIVLGMIHLSLGVRAGDRWLAAWTAVMAAGIGLDALTWAWDDLMWPILWTPSKLDLVAVSAGFCLAGALMMVILVMAPRRARQPNDAGRALSLGVGVAVLAIGASASAAAGFNWLVLALSWFLGGFDICVAVIMARREREMLQTAG